MANYIDGFVLPIPKTELDTYKGVSQKIAQIWKEYGALDYFEYVGDDLKLEGTRSFTEVTDAKADEAIVFGWVVFPSKEVRDEAIAKVPHDPRMHDLIVPLIDPLTPIFNAERMIYGGFKSLVKSS